MKRFFAIIFLILISFSDKAQAPLYHPPAGNTVWDTISPQSLGWCQERIDTLYNYLQLKHTRGFIILKDGKIALEKYFGTFTKDSLWYWASAGKSLTSFLTGMAQEEGALDIDDSTSQYLGLGWTSETPQQEGLIKIRHQLTMTTGIDYNVQDNECTDPTCLNYLADAGSFWYYHTGPYRLINNVIESATGINYNIYTNSHVKTRIGMSSGIWLQDVFYSRTRDAARFGLLMLGKGIWNTDTLMHDTAYYHDMINTSQPYNLSYGYLWWLNGKASYMLPQTTFVFNGPLMPDAPQDIYAALGKNDQKIYVCPSENMVVVRFGDAAGVSLLAPSTFDNEVWIRIMNLACTTSVKETSVNNKVSIYPNPGMDNLTISFAKPLSKSSVVELYNFNGQLIYGEVLVEGNTNYKLNIGTQPAGIYLYKIQTDDGVVTGKLLIE